MALARPIPEKVLAAAAERLAGRIAVSGPDDCWAWTGSRDGKGYGKIGIGKADWRVTRLVMALEGHKLAADLNVCHHCDNPPCCNPAHLFLGTDADNTADRLRKGRTLQRRGTMNPRAKLTPEMVRQIRNSPLGHRRLAKALGLGRTTIRDARSGRNWSHI